MSSSREPTELKMAFVDESWQSKCPTIRDRTTHIFNQDILSDVKFLVPVSNRAESESKRVQVMIPAHKFVLALASPVFFAMFYGQLVDPTDTIELPDCDFESLLELFRYLYTDNVNLNGNNVMQVMYLAKKYLVPSLVEKCTEYLKDILDVSNVFCILPYANKFEDIDLQDRCWKVIERHTEEAVTSDDFVTVDRSILESLVTKEVLAVKEVTLFKALDRWSRNECKRQGMFPDGDAKRRMLGEEIVKAIRFPMMSQKEFCSVVPDCNILTMKEIVDMMKHYSDVLTSPLQFLKIPRIHLHWCFRFGKLPSPAIAPNLSPTVSDYGGVLSNICVTTNQDVNVLGVQHFGCEHGVYKVSIEIKETIRNGSSLIRESGWYLSEKDKVCDYYVFDVFLPRPLCLESRKTYKISSTIYGPVAWYGQGGKSVVESAGVTFLFSKRKSNQLTDINKGQFPALIFTLP